VYPVCVDIDIFVCYVSTYLTYLYMCQYVHLCGYHVHALMHGRSFHTIHLYVHKTHTNVGRYTYAYKNDASLSLRVPAQASLQQSADDAA
jgi:hypothetical protein